MKSFLRANWDRALALALVVAGIVVLVLGWFGVSGTGLVAEQNPYLISAGLGGIALLIVGCTTWLSADLQDEWRRMDAIEEHLRRIGTVDQEERRGEATETTREVPAIIAEVSTNGSWTHIPVPEKEALAGATKRRSNPVKDAVTPAAARRKGGRRGLDSQAETS